MRVDRFSGNPVKIPMEAEGRTDADAEDEGTDGRRKWAAKFGPLKIDCPTKPSSFLPIGNPKPPPRRRPRPPPCSCLAAPLEES